MIWNRLHAIAACTLVFLLAGSADVVLGQPSAIENLNAPARLTAEQFAAYQSLVKPASDETPWAKISWHASVWEARKLAAAQGKPILIWSGGGSPPLGVC